MSDNTCTLALQWIRTLVWPNDGPLNQGGQAQSPEQDVILRQKNKEFVVKMLRNSYVSTKEVSTCTECWVLHYGVFVYLDGEGVRETAGYFR